MKLRTYKFHQDKRSIHIFQEHYFPDMEVLGTLCFLLFSSFSYSLSSFSLIFFFPKEIIKQRCQSQLINAHTIKKQPIPKQWPLSILIQLPQEDFSADHKICAIKILFKYINIKVSHLVDQGFSKYMLKTGKILAQLGVIRKGAFCNRVKSSNHMNPSKNGEKVHQSRKQGIQIQIPRDSHRYISSASLGVKHT